MASGLPRDLSWSDFTASSGMPTLPALYFGLRMDVGTANGWVEAVPISGLDVLGFGGVLFANPNPSFLTPLNGAIVPWIENLGRLVDVQASLQWATALGTITTANVRKMGVAARVACGGPTSSSTNGYAAFADCQSALLFYAQGLGTPGQFRFKLTRYNGTTNAETVLAETAALLEYEGSMFQPVTFRLLVDSDDLSTAHVLAQVRDTVWQEPVAQTVGAQAAPGASAIGYNVGPIDAGSALVRLSRNAFHGALPWVSETAAGAKNLVDNGTPVAQDANGMPTAVASGQRIATALFRGHLAAGVDSSPLPSYRAGTYFVEWTGGPVTWEVANDGASLVQLASGRISFEVATPSADGVHLAIVALTPSDPPTGLRCYHEDDEGAIDSSIWDIAAAEELGIHNRVLRWAGALRVETSEAEDFADLAPDGSLFWTGAAGVPLGQVLAFSSFFARDLWLAVPERLTDAALESVFARVRDELDPSLLVYVERGHEPWRAAYQEDLPTNPGVWVPVAGAGLSALEAWKRGNDATPHGSVTDGQVIGTPLDADPEVAQWMGAGQLAEEVFAIARETFDVDAQLGRLRFVVSTRASETDVTEAVLGTAPSAQIVALACQVPDFDEAMVDLTDTPEDIVAALDAERATTAGHVAAQRALLQASYGLGLAAYALGPRLTPADSTELANALGAMGHADMEALVVALFADWVAASDGGLAVYETSHQIGSVAGGVRGARRYVGESTSTAKAAAGLVQAAGASIVAGDGAAPRGPTPVALNPTPGYQVVEAEEWTTVFEADLTGGQYPSGVDAVAVVGDLLQLVNGNTAAYGALCSSFRVLDGDSEDLLWADDWTGRVGSLCRVRSVLGVFWRDFSSAFPGDAGGYGLQLVPGYGLAYDAADEAIAVASANTPGRELYQRPADSLKSQRRVGTFVFSTGATTGVAGLIARGVYLSGSPGTFVGYRLELKLAAGVFSGELWRLGADLVDVRLATFSAAGVAIETPVDLEMTVYDQLFDGSDGPVVIEGKLNSTPIAFDVQPVEGVTTLGTAARVVDRSAQRIVAGREGIVLEPGGTVRCRAWVQLDLVTEDVIPIEDVPSLPWPAENDGPVETVALSPSWEAVRIATSRGAQSSMVSGRYRRGSMQTRVRDGWTLTGFVSGAELAALQAQFDRLGSETPFNLDAGDALEFLSARKYVFASPSIRAERVASQSGSQVYRVEMAVQEVLNGS
jgi:hypothetical protein